MSSKTYHFKAQMKQTLYLILSTHCDLSDYLYIYWLNYHKTERHKNAKALVCKEALPLCCATQMASTFDVCEKIKDRKNVHNTQKENYFFPSRFAQLRSNVDIWLVHWQRCVGGPWDHVTSGERQNGEWKKISNLGFYAKKISGRDSATLPTLPLCAMMKRVNGWRGARAQGDPLPFSRGIMGAAHWATLVSMCTHWVMRHRGYLCPRAQGRDLASERLSYPRLWGGRATIRTPT